MTAGLAHRVIATAGHVDHGKSTLVRRLTGMEPDRLSEERRRGLSIELGFAWGQPDPAGGVLAFVDVPGHERFIATMLAGTGGSPAALFVVAADDGWSAQSTEHAEALTLLDIPVVCVAITKSDSVEENRLNEVTAEIGRLGHGMTVGDAPIVAVDSLTSRGIDTLARVLTDGVRKLPSPRDVTRPRLWIDRAFTIAGAGTVVTGTLEGGSFAVNDTVRLMPADRSARIRGLQQLGQPVTNAAAGSRLAVNLAGIDLDHVRRGDALVGQDPWHVTSSILATIRALPGREIGSVGAWHLHVGTTDVGCRIEPLTSEGDAQVVARVHLDRALGLVTGDRFVLRDVGRRIIAGGGIVIDPIAPPRPRRSDRADFVTFVRDLSTATPSTRLVGLTRLAGGLRARKALFAAAGWPSTAPLPDELVAVGNWVVTTDARTRWIEAVERLGDGIHTRETITATLQGTSGVVEHLVASGVLARRSGGYTLAERADAAEQALQSRYEHFLAELSEQGMAPDRLDALAARHGLDHRQVTALVQQGSVVPLGTFAMASGTITEAVSVLAKTVGADGRAFTAAAAKEAWGTSRKYAIPLLEHLDRTGVTRFDGQLRVLTGPTSPDDQSSMARN